MNKLFLAIVILFSVQIVKAETSDKLTCMYNTSRGGMPLIILHRNPDPSPDTRIGKPIVFANYRVRNMTFSECEIVASEWKITECVFNFYGAEKKYQCLKNSRMNVVSSVSDNTEEKGVAFVIDSMTKYLLKYAESR